jgi:hypothetical protein
MSILNTTLTTSAATSIYISAGNSAVTTAYFCNKTPNSVLVNVHVVLAASIASGDNIIYSNLSIAGYDTYIMETERLLFNNGDFIAANCSAGSTVISTVSYTGI